MCSSDLDRRVLTDVHVPTGQASSAEPGEMVLVEITRWPTATRGPVGRVVEVLGNINEPGVDTEIIIRKFGIPDAHSPDAIAEAERIGGAVQDKDIRGRTGRLFPMLLGPSTAGHGAMRSFNHSSRSAVAVASSAALVK